jgi:general secretion pathway protein G
MEWNRMDGNRRCEDRPGTDREISKPVAKTNSICVRGPSSYRNLRGVPVRRRLKTGQHGLTLVELIVTVAILAILASVAYPIARFQIQRRKEQLLRDDLWQMRHAIDAYKDAADRNAIRTEIDTAGYPPDLDTLVKGVNIQEHNVKFLRAIPIDPMTGKQDWVLRSMQDDPESDSWGGQNVFDVHSASDGTAMNGTKYSTW